MGKGNNRRYPRTLWKGGGRWWGDCSSWKHAMGSASAEDTTMSMPTGWSNASCSKHRSVCCISRRKDVYLQNTEHQPRTHSRCYTREDAGGGGGGVQGTRGNAVKRSLHGKSPRARDPRHTHPPPRPHTHSDGDQPCWGPAVLASPTAYAGAHWVVTRAPTKE